MQWLNLPLFCSPAPLQSPVERECGRSSMQRPDAAGQRRVGKVAWMQRITAAHDSKILLAGFLDVGLHDLGITFHGQNGGVLFYAIGTAGNDRQNLPSIGHAEPHREGAIGTQSHRFASKSHIGVWLSRPVDDHLGIDFELEIPLLVQQTICTYTEACDDGGAHRASQAFFEKLAQFAVGSIRVKPATHREDLFTVLGDIGPIFVDAVAAARSRGFYLVAPAKRMEAVVGGLVADGDSVGGRRCGNVDVPIRDLAVNVDVPDDSFRRVRRADVLNLQQSQHRPCRMPLFGERNLSPFDGGARQFPVCLQPIRISHNQHDPILGGNFLSRASGGCQIPQPIAICLGVLNPLQHAR